MRFIAIAALCVLALLAAGGRASASPIPVRVVVVTTFEIGADAGDIPGEFQYWVTRLPLPQTLAFPQGYRALRFDPARGILGIVTGEGAERGAASVMALGSDPRFDVSHAYWVVAGIAGVDPNVASVGSAAWAQWVVNGDLGFEIDPRDAPPAWPIGIVPFDRTGPYRPPLQAAESLHGELAYHLNPALVDWAYARTRMVALGDDAHLRAVRAAYRAYPNAYRPPFILQGDALASDRFWIGSHMNRWAERWTAYWTHGHGRFAMTAEEDAGIMQSLTFLGRAKRIDPQRILVLRTASDYDTPGAGQTAMTLLNEDAVGGGESGYLAALESAYRIGSPVVLELATHWSRYRDKTPGLKKSSR